MQFNFVSVLQLYIKKLTKQIFGKYNISGNKKVNAQINEYQGFGIHLVHSYKSVLVLANKIFKDQFNLM